MHLNRFRQAVLGHVFSVTFAGVATFLLVAYVVLLPIDDRVESGLPYSNRATVLRAAIEPVPVRVNGDGTVQIRGKQVPVQDIVGEFRALRLRRETDWAVVSASSGVSYECVRVVLRNLEEAGATRISLRTAKFEPVEARRRRGAPDPAPR